MRILVSGSTGLVGSALVSLLKNSGHEAIPLVRLKSQPDSVLWNPADGTIAAAALEDIDAVVHLAGENIAARRWTTAHKAHVRESRIGGTRLLAETCARLQRPPKALVSASAVGYYGDRGTEILREDSAAGRGFLPDLCRDWEAATVAASRNGIRVVHVRIGLVLSGKGGALPKMLPPFKLGAGGRIGSGEQYWSWISIDDLCEAILYSVETDTLHGPVNAVSPSAVTNLEFTKTLARVLSRPAVFPLPAFAARIVLGEMANELLLASARVEPAKLLASGFTFRHIDLETALRDVLHL